MAEKIKAMFIFEILGRPPEHIKETLSQLIDKLAELPGVEISSKKVHEPKKLEKEGAKDLFTTFAEVEILGKDLNTIIMLVFHALPSHVEIIEPDELTFKNFDISGLLSDLTLKLHRYDEIAKAITIERNILANKLKEIKGEIEIEHTKPENKKIKKKIKKAKKK